MTIIPSILLDKHPAPQTTQMCHAVHGAAHQEFHTIEAMFNCTVQFSGWNFYYSFFWNFRLIYWKIMTRGWREQVFRAATNCSEQLVACIQNMGSIFGSKVHQPRTQNWIQGNENQAYEDKSWTNQGLSVYATPENRKFWHQG